MAKIKNVSFKEVIEESDVRDRSILLGNGFSISLCKSFDYDELYKQAQYLSQKGEISIGEIIKQIFKDLNTSDFEKVLAYLNVTIEITKHYPQSNGLNTALKADRTNLITSFLNTINSVHPRYKALIKTQTYISCLRLLSKFNKIFTTNYDVLLYWIIMERNSISSFELKNFDISCLPIDDGFKRGASTNQLLIWDEYHREREQKIFYLHGSLFIFDDENSYIKMDHNNEGSILEKLEKLLKSNKKPLIVLEGSAKDKIDKIYRHAYLRYCLNSLKNLNGDLFLLGFSINDKSDKHIIESIQQSDVKRLFVSCHGKPNEELKKRIKLLAHMNESDKERELYVFNSNEVIDWEAIQLNSSLS